MNMRNMALLGVVLFLLIALVTVMTTSSGTSGSTEISYSQFQHAVDSGAVYAYSGDALRVFHPTTGILQTSITDPTFTNYIYEINGSAVLGGPDSVFAAAYGNSFLNGGLIGNLVNGGVLGLLRPGESDGLLGRLSLNVLTPCEDARVFLVLSGTDFIEPAADLANVATQNSEQQHLRTTFPYIGFNPLTGEAGTTGFSPTNR